MKITLNKFMPLLVVAGFSLAGSSAALATDYTVSNVLSSLQQTVSVNYDGSEGAPLSINFLDTFAFTLGSTTPNVSLSVTSEYSNSGPVDDGVGDITTSTKDISKFDVSLVKVGTVGSLGDWSVAETGTVTTLSKVVTGLAAGDYKLTVSGTATGTSQLVHPGQTVFTTLGFAGLYFILGLLFLFLVSREIANGPLAHHS